jgi:AMME syndrome candidate gene 1 protein
MAFILANGKAAELDGGESNVCLSEHCFHAFNALDCALTSAAAIPATFPDDK